MSKLSEYNHLRSLLYQKLIFVQKDFLVRVVLVGRPPLRDFVVSVTKENRLKLTLVNHYSHWTDLKGIDLQTFDIALLFDGNSEAVTKISEHLNIPTDKLAALW